MRAIVLDEHSLRLEQRARPVPGPGQVLARTLACGICGSDLHLYRHVAEIKEAALQMGVPEEALAGGIVLGHEFVAELVEMGDAAGAGTTVAVGDRVCSMPFLLAGGVPLPIGASPMAGGAFADYLLLSRDLLIPVPPDLPTEAAALTEPFGIAVHAIAKAALTDDATVLVVGCGPIGLAITAVLRARGRTNIVVADLVPEKLERARRLGADHTVPPGTEPCAAALATAPGKPLVVFDCTGARGMLGRLITHGPQNVRIIVAGIAPGEDVIMPMLAISKEIAIQFVVYYTPAEFAEALALLASGAISWAEMITAKVPLEAVPDTFQQLDGASAHAKILVMPDLSAGA